MKYIAILVLILSTALQCRAEGEPIHRHIFFKLEMPIGSPEEKAFIEQTEALAALPSVKAFVWLRVAPGHKQFTHGLRIVFADKPAIKRYTQDPLHRRYIKEVWAPVVKDAQLTDYTESPVVPPPAS